MAVDGEEQEEEQQQENTGKRSASSGSAAAANDAYKYLLSNSLDNLLQQGKRERNFWLCMAELNVLLRAFQHTFTLITRLEYRCFSRNSKSSAFEALAWALGCRLPSQLQQNQHLQALYTVLEAACADCTEVCLSQLTIAVPAWLEPWAQNWLPDGCGGAARRVTLSVVQAYQAAPAPLRASAVYNLGQPVITTAAPHKTLYIPWMPEPAHLS
ncbi:hypothetical protein N2152v2_007507 [Parachlorella kessleri]